VDFYLEEIAHVKDSCFVGWLQTAGKLKLFKFQRRADAATTFEMHAKL
jgi:hypothetical protein